MPSPKRSGAYLVSRAVKSRAAGALSLAEYGLLNRIWDDLRWTPKRVQTRTGWFDLQAGQAVISVAAYAAEFRCHHRVITKGLEALQEAGWFTVESSTRGTIVTCLVDPRDCQPRAQEPQDATEGGSANGGGGGSATGGGPPSANGGGGGSATGGGPSYYSIARDTPGS